MQKNVEWGSLILRVVLGVTFLAHGLAKFQMGLDNLSGWFGSIGIPGLFAYLVALLETIGGVALIVGLGTRVLSGLLAVVMAVAIVKVKMPAGFLGGGNGAGYELDLALLAMLVYLVLNGSSLYSIDSLVFGRKS
jgi:putative oxidoreductase